MKILKMIDNPVLWFGSATICRRIGRRTIHRITKMCW